MAQVKAQKLVLDRVARRFGHVEAVREVSIEIGEGEVVSLLGPSGCGKSTTLRIAAGVERPDGGRVVISGREVAGPKTFVPPEQRGIGLIFQDYALFPHLTVAQNIAFGLREKDGQARRRRVMGILERVSLARYADAYPGTLSGGEQQRVALARALAPGPGVMLMDEPFSNLDTVLRDAIRDQTWRLLKEAGTATLLVTHDPKEAMRMADRIALMREGRIVQIGTPQEVYTAPRDAEIAGFFSDLNVLETAVEKGAAWTPFGPVPAPQISDGAAVRVMARPQALCLSAPERNEAVPARVVRSLLLGPESLIEAAVEGCSQRLRVLTPGTVLPEEGAVIYLELERSGVFVFEKP